MKPIIIPNNLSDKYFDKGVATPNKIEYKFKYTIASLKASANSPSLVYITDINKQGMFEYNSSDTTSVGDDFNIIVDNSGKRWKRTADASKVNINNPYFTGDVTIDGNLSVDILNSNILSVQDYIQYSNSTKGVGKFLQDSDGQGNLIFSDISFNSLTDKPTTIAEYGITDFNTLGDSRYSLKTNPILTGLTTTENIKFSNQNAEIQTNQGVVSITDWSGASSDRKWKFNTDESSLIFESNSTTHPVIGVTNPLSTFGIFVGDEEKLRVSPTGISVNGLIAFGTLGSKDLQTELNKKLDKDAAVLDNLDMNYELSFIGQAQGTDNTKITISNQGFGLNSFLTFTQYTKIGSWNFSGDNILTVKNSNWGFAGNSNPTATIDLGSSGTLKIGNLAGAGKVLISDNNGNAAWGNQNNVDYSGLSVFADNAAAISGGLVIGKLYRTSTGSLNVVF